MFTQEARNEKKIGVKMLYLEKKPIGLNLNGM